LPAASDAAAAAATAPGRPLSAALVLAVAVIGALLGDAINPPSRQWSARAAETAVTAYRGSVSPLLARTGLVRCRFTPTCSAYGLEALHRHGFFRGSALAAWRVLRCNPLSKGGVDPVP
jgi:putative membrane protein insertion efficiency factor